MDLDGLLKKSREDGTEKERRFYRGFRRIGKWVAVAVPLLLLIFFGLFPLIDLIREEDRPERTETETEEQRLQQEVAAQRAQDFLDIPDSNEALIKAYCLAPVGSEQEEEAYRRIAEEADATREIEQWLALPSLKDDGIARCLSILPRKPEWRPELHLAMSRPLGEDTTVVQPNIWSEPIRIQSNKGFHWRTKKGQSSRIECRLDFGEPFKLSKIKDRNVDNARWMWCTSRDDSTYLLRTSKYPKR